MKAAEKKCARLVQEIVCLRDRVCQLPGCRRTPISGHHVLGRSNHGSAFEPDSLLGFCIWHHVPWAHKHPQECKDLLRSIIGEKRFSWLEVLSREVVRYREKDYRLIAEGLRKQLEGKR